jgi:chemotaxis protein MotB
MASDETRRLQSYDDAMREALDLARPSRTPWVLLVLALGAGAALAVWLLFRLDRAGSEAAAASSGLADARAQLEQARADRVDLAMRLEKLEAEKADLLALENELSRDVRAKEEQISSLRGAMGELEEKMKTEIEKGNVRLSQANGRIKVDVVDEILFDVGEASISTRGEEVLARVGGVLAKVADRRVQVSGHTDDLPISPRLQERFPTNWELSSARAITVVRFLQEKAGIPGRRLVAAAHSQYEPISTNRSAGGRARNRRIEILLTPDLAPERAQGAAPTAAAPAQGAAKAPAQARGPAKGASTAAKPAKAAARPPSKPGARQASAAVRAR